MKTSKINGEWTTKELQIDKNWLINLDHLDKAKYDLLSWIDEGKINPHVDKVFSKEQASDAHHYIQDRKNIGKVLIDFD